MTSKDAIAARVRVISYNLLAPELSTPATFPENDKDEVDGKARFPRILQQLEDEVARGSILCLQEVSQTWVGLLHTFFASKNYHYVHSLYGRTFNGYMGCGTAFPTAKYELLECKSVRIADSKRERDLRKYSRRVADARRMKSTGGGTIIVDYRLASDGQTPPTSVHSLRSPREIRQSQGRRWDPLQIPQPPNIVIMEQANENRIAKRANAVLLSLRQRLARLPRLARVFKAWDMDGNGTLNRDEVVRALHLLNVRLEPDELEAIFRTFDEDNSGSGFMNVKRLDIKWINEKSMPAGWRMLCDICANGFRT
eukprot:g4037.t1